MTRFETIDDRVAIITGGMGGVGRAVCKKFLEVGMTVALCDINVRQKDRFRQELISEGYQHYLDKLSFWQLDVSSFSDCGHVISEVNLRFSRIDVLVNCAGIWIECKAEDASEQEWNAALQVNLSGTFFMCRHAVPYLRDTRGTIINISSDSATIGSYGSSIYGATKAGVNQLTRCLAIELAESSIRVNSVCPSDIAGPMLDRQAKVYGGGNPEEYKARLLSEFPQKSKARFIAAEEVALLIAYLCNQSSTPITGACIPIDFGTTAGVRPLP